MSIEIEKVDPEYAETLLLGNTHNRNLRDREVKQIASDMREGRWIENVQSMTIQIAEDGTIIDGQHRLTAIVESGVTVNLLIARDVDWEVQEVIDTGARRSIADMIKLRGGANYSIVSSALPYFYAHYHDIDFGKHPATWRPSDQALMSLYTNLRPVLEEATHEASKVWGAVKVGPHSIVAYRWWQFGTIDDLDRDDFFDRLRLLQFRGEGDPIKLMYRTFERMREDRTRTVTTMHKHALLVKAWNAYRTGNEPKLLRWSAGGASPEQFPEAM